MNFFEGLKVAKTDELAIVENGSVLSSSCLKDAGKTLLTTWEYLSSW